MASGEAIVLRPRASDFLTWRPSSEILQTFYIAILSTLLSYQLTAIAFDVCQGWKKRNHTTAAALCKHLLAITPSPMELLASLLRSDTFVHLRFPRLPHGLLPRNPGYIFPSTIVSLVVILLITPITHLVSLFLVFERPKTLPFSEVSFTGVALGVLSNKLQTREVHNCQSAPLDVPNPYKPRMEFLVCLRDTFVEFIEATTTNFITYEVSIEPDATIVVQQYTPCTQFPNVITRLQHRFHASLSTGTKYYRIAHAFDPEAVAKGMELELKRVGRDEVSLLNVGPTEINDQGTRVKKTVTINATELVDVPECFFSTYTSIASALMIGLLDVDTMRVAEEGTLDFQERGDLIALERNTGVVGEAALGILVLTAIIFRVIVKLVTRNDVEMGLQFVLERYFGELSLWSQSEVRYDHCYVFDGTVLYGLERQDPVDEWKAHKGGDHPQMGNVESPPPGSLN